MRLLACALLLLPALAGAAEAQGQARLTLLGGLDTNPRRDFGEGNPLDAESSLEAFGQGALASGRWSLLAKGGLGGRIYASASDQNVFVQQLSLEGRAELGGGFSLSLLGHGKDVLGGDRPYADLSAGPSLQLSLGPSLSVELTAEGRRFLYRPLLAYSYGALEVSGGAGYRFAAHHLGTLSLASSSRTFNAAPATAPGLGASEPRREDTVLSCEVGYRYRGPFSLGVSYAFVDDASNSFGESAQHHRVDAQLGVRLPWRTMLFVSATLQLSHYPDGVFLSPELLLVEDSEALDSAAARLVRPLGPHLDAELRYGLYATRLPSNGLSYLRQLMTVGFTLRE
jgi:hypothetical protein